MRKKLDITNNLKTLYPKIAKEWDYEKNETSPESYFPKSSFVAWWICPTCGRSYQMRIQHRADGHGCKICNKKRAIEKTRTKRIIHTGNLAKTNPELVKEWNPFLNNGLKPKNFSKGSNKKITWTCSTCNQVWSDTISHRVLGRGCPYCKGTKIIKGINDLQTLYPYLAKEWGPSNVDEPTNFSPNSTKKVYWLCPNCNREYLLSIRERINGCGCTVCSSHKLIKGYNDLKTKYPEIAKEWDYIKNTTHPDDYFPNSREKIFWVCPKGHSYEASIHNRVNGTGCPKCDKERKTSFPEQAILFYLSKITKAQNRAIINGFEVDIFLPELNVGIEYDGIYFHNRAYAFLKESKKDSALSKKGIKVFRVKEIRAKTNSYVDGNVLYYSMSNSNYDNFAWVINAILDKIGLEKININIQRDSIEIKSNYFSLVKENSIARKFPKLAMEWNYELNNNINPEFVTIYSNQKYYWTCQKCHQSYLATPSHRIRKNNGCPICSNHQIVVGINDFQTTHKKELLDWDFSKNILKPTDITYGSEKKIFWKCHKCGHEWIQYPYMKIKYGCPSCKKQEQKKLYGKKVLNIETGVVFDSLHDAAQSINKSSGVSPISNCCKGKRKSAYGYHWKFISKN